MRIIFACDHAGFEMKEYLKEYVTSLGYDVDDKGAFEYNEEDDYPDFISLAAREVSNDPEHTKAIVLGGSGQGEAIVSNRYKNVRAVVYIGEPANERTEVADVIELGRTHNNSNVLSLGARFLTNAQAEEAVKKWIDTPFSEEERHLRRNNKIDSIE